MIRSESIALNVSSICAEAMAPYWRIQRLRFAILGMARGSTGAILPSVDKVVAQLNDCEGVVAEEFVRELLITVPGSVAQKDVKLFLEGFAAMFGVYHFGFRNARGIEY